MSRYLVLGAGAVGCALGAMLQRSGADVVYCARGEQLAALQTAGLSLHTPGDSFELEVVAVGSPDALDLSDDDVVLLCTKSQQSRTALDAIRRAAHGSPAIVCAQNGVDNEPLAAERFPRVYGAMVFVPVTHLEPGHVHLHSTPVAGVVDVGAYPSGADALAHDLASALRNAGFDARADAQVMRLKHAKLLSNLGNAVQALVSDAAAAAPLIDALRAEALACFAAAGIDHGSLAELHARCRHVNDREAGGLTRPGGSSWQSLARRTGDIETDHLNGFVVRLGRRFDIPTPLNRALVRVALRAATEHWPPGSLPLADLESMLGS